MKAMNPIPFESWIVVERTGLWAKGLRALVRRQVAIQELRAKEELFSILYDAPHSLVLLAPGDWQTSARESAEFIARCVQATSLCRVFVATRDALVTRLAWEVGAIGVFTSVAELARLGSWATTQANPSNGDSLRAEILRRTPWPPSIKAT
jgi:hypothetical protein